MQTKQTNLVHGFGEAIEVVDGVVSVNDVDGGNIGVPVAGDDENGGGWRRKLLFP